MTAQEQYDVLRAQFWTQAYNTELAKQPYQGDDRYKLSKATADRALKDFEERFRTTLAPQFPLLKPIPGPIRYTDFGPFS